MQGTYRDCLIHMEYTISPHWLQGLTMQLLTEKQDTLLKYLSPLSVIGEGSVHVYVLHPYRLIARHTT